jgi:hypothetical protein
VHPGRQLSDEHVQTASLSGTIISRRPSGADIRAAIGRGGMVGAPTFRRCYSPAWSASTGFGLRVRLATAVVLQAAAMRLRSGGDSMRLLSALSSASSFACSGSSITNFASYSALSANQRGDGGYSGSPFSSKSSLAPSPPNSARSTIKPTALLLTRA